MDLINLALIATSPMVMNEVVNVQVVATSATVEQNMTSTDLVFQWDPSVLQLIGIDNTNNLEALISFLPQGNWDYYGINESMPPADGNGLYFWLAPLTGIPVYVPTSGALMTTLQFRVLQPVPTTVEILPSYTVFYTANTVIYGSSVPGTNVTGKTTNAQLSCASGDFNCDGGVGSADMAMMLTSWNDTSFTENPYDLNNNGVVDAGDLSILLDNWG